MRKAVECPGLAMATTGKLPIDAETLDYFRYDAAAVEI